MIKLSSDKKQLHWDKMVELINTITDGLGNPIDEELKELITALNILDFRTEMSCFGHIRDNEKLGIKNRLNTPYVSLNLKTTKPVEIQENKLSEQVKKLTREDIQDPLKNKVYKDWEKFLYEHKMPYMVKLRVLIELLNSFYKNRTVLYENQITVRGMSKIMLKNIGSADEYYNYHMLNEETLKQYQKEFIDFGTFLKKKYFESDGKKV